MAEEKPQRIIARDKIKDFFKENENCQYVQEGALEYGIIFNTPHLDVLPMIIKYLKNQGIDVTDLTIETVQRDTGGVLVRW